MDAAAGGSVAARRGSERPFAVPAQAASGIAFARIASGPAWPAELPRVDRLAALPTPLGAACEGAAAGDVVLAAHDGSGRPTPICVDGGSAVRWGVDPVGWIQTLLGERYVGSWRRPLTSRVPLFNYSRLPNRVKGRLERLASPRAPAPNPVAFPELPLDPLVDTLRALCTALAGGRSESQTPGWPDGRRAAVTLTHDVDVSWILDARRSALLDRILDTETSLGFRGAWYVTANRLQPKRHERAVRRIRDAGHEIGAHGWSHDSRLGYLSEARQAQRLRSARQRLSDAGCEGIRTPWYCRTPDLLRVIARSFAYDSSVPNASAYFSSGCNSGCCTVFPYEVVSGLWELPMTLPPDTALDSVDGYRHLHRSCDLIVALGGVVVLTFHPQPHQSGNPAALAYYARFLRELVERHGPKLWHATPRDIVKHYARLCDAGKLP